MRIYIVHVCRSIMIDCTLLDARSSVFSMESSFYFKGFFLNWDDVMTTEA